MLDLVPLARADLSSGVLFDGGSLVPLFVMVRMVLRFGDVVNLSMSDKCGHSMVLAQHKSVWRFEIVGRRPRWC